jgi:chromate transporter
MLLPLLIVLVAGMLYLATRGMPGGGWLGAALAGAGAAAIGLNLATGIRLARRNIRRPAPALIAAAITVGIGILRVPLFAALLVMIPLSLLISWAGYRR